jgi:Na+/H+ antiporter family
MEGTEQTFIDKIEHSDSYLSFLWGTMGTSLLTVLLYLLQWYKSGQAYARPPIYVMYALICQKEESTNRLTTSRTSDSTSNNTTNNNNNNNMHDIAFTACPHENNDDDNEQDTARPLVSLPIAVESYLCGMANFFPAMVVLFLAWSIGHVMMDVGTDRLFARWIMNNIKSELLPTVTFLISFLITLSIGCAWGTMSILYPLVLVPTFVSSQGNETIFYAVVASVLNGAVAGNHMCPISDTTIVSSLAADCAVMQHVATPYCVVVVIATVLFGTLPIGYQLWSSYISTILGIIILSLFVYFGCVPIIEPSGKYDIFTELYLTLIQNNNNKSNLQALREDTIIFTTVQEINFSEISTSPDKDSLRVTDPTDDEWSDKWREDDYDL